jgi:ribosomal protein S12 methylthiotransferase
MNFYIDQYGCAKNQVDGEELLARLEADGHRYVSKADEADLIIVNTCGFIEDAKKESIEAVMKIRTLFPEKKILVAGCLAQRYSTALLSDMQEADGFFGNADLSKISSAVAVLEKGDREAIALPQPRSAEAVHYRRSKRFDFPGSAYVKITEGCDNCCSYCAIPLIRGHLRSRPECDIIAECRELLEEGVREIQLIGQDLGSYGKDISALDTPGAKAVDLASLLKGILEIPLSFRIRILYIHPDNFPESILDIIEKDSRVLPYFDLPFQHASEKVLKSMNRRGNIQTYLELIRKIRKRLPESMIRSTFLTGFPGESEDDFQTLRDFQDAARLDWLGIFRYSREEGTQAYSMKGKVPRKIANERKTTLEIAQTEITSKRLERFLGREIDVLMEEPVEGSELMLGRAWMQAPDVDGLTLVHGIFKPGEMIRCTIRSINGVDFEADPCGLQH